ncbi:MAG: ABC transporter ATP-binding protein [Oscillospiraceae bacterium]|nr:ABC transporter ATP-binding protein [Oscillospiraceae bacterium]
MKWGENLAFIEITNLRKIYRLGNEKVVALKNINLEINKGEVCCILGTSGSGKSTLLNMLAGLEKPTRGDILINGTNIAKLSERKLASFRQKNTGFVFQSYNLIPQLTALENVGMPLMFKGIPKSVRNKQALKMLKAVGLADRRKHRPNQMSGGQQQRVGIARAFVAKPNVIFADEPTGNLDTKTTEDVMKLMVEMCRNHNLTLIIVTHDLEIAAYADRIVHIIDGEITSIEENNISDKENTENEREETQE